MRKLFAAGVLLHMLFISPVAQVIRPSWHNTQELEREFFPGYGTLPPAPAGAEMEAIPNLEADGPTTLTGKSGVTKI